MLEIEIYPDVWVEVKEIEKSIDKYNPKALLLLVDELGELMSAEDYNLVGEMRESMKAIGRLGRAAGTHLALATQKPNQQSVPSELKMNIQQSCGLGNIDSGASTTLFDKDISYKCKPEIKGRGFVINQMRIEEYQSYYSTKEEDFVYKAVPPGCKPYDPKAAAREKAEKIKAEMEEEKRKQEEEMKKKLNINDEEDNEEWEKEEKVENMNEENNIDAEEKDENLDDIMEKEKKIVESLFLPEDIKDDDDDDFDDDFIDMMKPKNDNISEEMKNMLEELEREKTKIKRELEEQEEKNSENSNDETSENEENTRNRHSERENKLFERPGKAFNVAEPNTDFYDSEMTSRTASRPSKLNLGGLKGIKKAEKRNNTNSSKTNKLKNMHLTRK